MSPDEKRFKAREHALGCIRCLPVVLMYRDEIEQAVWGGALPDALASKIRSRLCKRGAEVFDLVLEVAATP